MCVNVPICITVQNVAVIGRKGQEGQKCVTTPNLTAIGWTVAEIWRFFDFSWWRPRHLGFSNVGNIGVGKGQDGQNASPCQISRSSVKPLLWYGHFSIFQLFDFSRSRKPPSWILTSSSAITEGPRDAFSQLKSCQLLHNCTKNHI